MQKSRSGFTIVELLIVIVVIGILAAITIVAYNGIQERARDSERQQDMASVQKILELYYIDHNFFPNTLDITSPSWRKANFATQDQGIFINPQASSGSTNSIGSGGSVVTAATYSYYSIKNDGTLCTGGESACTEYVLTWRLEVGSALQQKRVKRS